jgi:hypothetical protein
VPLIGEGKRQPEPARPQQHVVTGVLCSGSAKYGVEQSSGAHQASWTNTATLPGGERITMSSTISGNLLRWKSHRFWPGQLPGKPILPTAGPIVNTHPPGKS